MEEVSELEHTKFLGGRGKHAIPFKFRELEINLIC